MTSRVLDKAPRPGTEEWSKIITASKIPTILGLDQWMTASELWMRMSGLVAWEQLEGDHLDWGHVAEDSLARWWKHKNPGWKLTPGEVAYTDDDLPFPNLVTIDRRASRGRSRHIVECKTSDSARVWDTSEELPGHVFAQVTAQQGVSGIHSASVVAQKGSTVPRIYDVEWSQEIWDGIIPVLAEFYKSLGNSEPPVPSLDLLDAIQDAVEPPEDGEQDADPALASELLELHRVKTDIDAQIKTIESKLVAGAPTKLKFNGKSLASYAPGRFAKYRVPDDFRHLLEDPAVMSTSLDSKKFAAKYPEIAAAATSEGSYRFTPKPFLKEK